MENKLDLWDGSFAQDVEGLEYEYPFEVGDVVYYYFDEEEANELSKRYPMKVIEVGVPVPKKYEYDKRATVHGRNGHFRKKTEDTEYQEGVRVQHIWFEGDKGHGFKENFSVKGLKKLDNFEQIKGE